MINCAATARGYTRFFEKCFKLMSYSARPYKTASVNPDQLNLSNVGNLYKVSTEEVAELELHKALPSCFSRQVVTLGECIWLCRKPFLEIKNCLKTVSDLRPNLRIVLWGKFGTGKTMTLCQTLQYAHLEGWIVFHVRNAMSLTREVREVQMSSYRDGRINSPAQAVDLLNTFRTNNSKMWKQLTDLRTTKDYEWSKVEKTSVDRPLTELVEMGLSAPFTASDCVGALLKELKVYSSKGILKLLVTIDYANSLYGSTRVKRVDKTFAAPNDLTLVHHLRKLFNNDWTNGACVMAVDKAEVASVNDDETIPLNTPLELLGEEGFEAIDPFIPLETTSYSEEEISNLYDYYKEKRWIASKLGRTERALKEMKYLSAYNPYDFERLCAFT